MISSLQHPAQFSAVPIEKVLDLFVKNRLEEVQQIQSRKNEILSDWKTIAFPEPEESSPKFTVIEGRGNIYSKIQQMLEETEDRFDFITSVTELMRIDEFGLFNVASGIDSMSRIRFRFLTELSDKNIPFIKVLPSKKEDQCEG